MPLFATATLLLPPRGGQDRLAIQQFDDRIVLVVADGAGGMRGGAEAAQFACDRVMQLAAASAGTARGWTERLHTIDQELSGSDHGGQTTLVVAEIWNGQVCGASVGDSEAWLLGDHGAMRDLTEHQQRKPLLGSGAARPCAFGPMDMAGHRLLMGTDGLFRYAAKDRVLDVAAGTVIPRVPSLVTDLARLPNGEFQDDVAVIVCEEDLNRANRLRAIGRPSRVRGGLALVRLRSHRVAVPATLHSLVAVPTRSIHATVSIMSSWWMERLIETKRRKSSTPFEACSRMRRCSPVMAACWPQRSCLASAARAAT